MIIENENKFICGYCSNGHKGAIKEVLGGSNKKSIWILAQISFGDKSQTHLIDNRAIPILIDESHNKKNSITVKENIIITRKKKAVISNFCFSFSHPSF